MIEESLVVFSLLAVVGLEASLLTFPPSFKFGAATAAYQIEGAWNASDKSASVWDEFTHKHQEKMMNGGDGDVACDSYHQWRRDVQMADELGLDFYRFSVSWTRICPTGFCERVSEEGSTYYNNLINGLLEKGIEPIITLFHWDLPQRLQDLGGWANPLLVDWFGVYTRVVFSLYADRVKTWITVNEPLILCEGVYGSFMAPMIDDALFGSYLCSKTVLLAHAKAWRIYDQEFRPKYHGKISLSNHLLWFEPKTKADEGLTDLALQHSAGRFSHAIFSKEGGWPPALEDLIAENSRKQGYPRSRLPPFTKEEIDLIRGTYDFYGVNFYTSRVVRSVKEGELIGFWPLRGSVELGLALELRPYWKDTAIIWMKQNPRGLRDLLIWLKQQYGNLTFLITENGLPTRGRHLEDQDRVEYIKDHLRQVLLAINKDGVNVAAYSAWSLMDNLEWMDGYLYKFGLYEVNFTDPQRTRTPRASAKYYASVIQTHNLDPPEKWGSYVIWVIVVAVLLVAVIFGVVFKCYRDRKKARRVQKTKPNDVNLKMISNID